MFNNKNMDTENYCKTLDKLDTAKAIRAIHEAYLQLEAIDKYDNSINWDNRWAIRNLKACLKDAGHIGFTD
jgi:hypothetical protein